MIDLGQTRNVEYVKIFNRNDVNQPTCCYQRLDNFQIRVGNSATFANNPACVTGEPWFKQDKSFPCVLTGRYVSIQQFNNLLMNLREVEVYGSLTSNTLNYARACAGGGCPTTSSSVYPSHFNYSPSKIVDGNLADDYNNLFVTEKDLNPWVLIDMQQTVSVTMVRVYNANVCCQDRLANFEIRIGDSSTFLNNALCGARNPNFRGYQDFTCVFAGRYVSLQMFATEHLNLQEIEIYGTLPASVGNAGSDIVPCPGNSSSVMGADNVSMCLCNVGYATSACWQHSAVVTTNSPESSRTYQSVWGNSAPGTGWARSMLDSVQAWSWDSISITGPQWMQINLGIQLRVHGVVTQCRADFEQSPHEIEVQYSLTASDFVSATAVGGSTRIFLPTTYSSTLKTLSYFSQPVVAQYIRIVVHAGSSFRAGVLTSQLELTAASNSSTCQPVCTACESGKYKAVVSNVVACSECSANTYSRTTHDAMLHSALWCCAPGLERIQHSVHSKSLALKCTEHSVLSK
jgi:hypothetical protein